jgi:hypothetical protein
MRIQRVDSLAEAAQFYAPSDKQLCRCGRPFARYGDGSYEPCAGCHMENPAVPR